MESSETAEVTLLVRPAMEKKRSGGEVRVGQKHIGWTPPPSSCTDTDCPFNLKEPGTHQGCPN